MLGMTLGTMQQGTGNCRVNRGCVTEIVELILSYRSQEVSYFHARED